MKRLPYLILLAGLTAYSPAGFAQEHGPSGEKAAESASREGSEGGEGGMEVWKWANFLVLAGGLGYLIGKNGGPFFEARSRKIRKGMVEAGDVRRDADARAAEVELRLQNLEAEIAALREESLRETQAEGERMAKRTDAEMAKVRAQAEQEIASAGKAAQMELRAHAAHLAVGLAEREIRNRLTPSAQEALVSRFVRDLERPAGNQAL